MLRPARDLGDHKEMSAVRQTRGRATRAAAESAVRQSPLPAALLADDFTILRTNAAWDELLHATNGFADRPLTAAVRGDERTALTLLLDKFEQSSDPVLRLYVHLALGRTELRRALLIIHRATSARSSSMTAHL